MTALHQVLTFRQQCSREVTLPTAQRDRLPGLVRRVFAAQGWVCRWPDHRPGQRAPRGRMADGRKPAM